MKKEIKVGDRVIVQQAWEDEAGAYHDEVAEVMAIRGEEAILQFESPELTKLLADTDGYTVGDLELV